MLSWYTQKEVGEAGWVTWVPISFHFSNLQSSSRPHFLRGGWLQIISGRDCKLLDPAAAPAPAPAPASAPDSSRTLLLCTAAWSNFKLSHGPPGRTELPKCLLAESKGRIFYFFNCSIAGYTKKKKKKVTHALNWNVTLYVPSMFLLI